MTELTIIQQNDTHGQLQTHPELFWRNGSPSYRRAGGFARIAAFVNKLRLDAPNVLFADGGDLLHGTGPLLLSQGEVMIPLLRAMSIDVCVPGNWDFAYGFQQLKSLSKALPFPLTALNLTSDSGDRIPMIPPYILKEYKDLKIGIIGLTYPYVHETMPGSFSEGLSFSLGVSELPDMISALRTAEHADLIIVLSHMGLPLDAKLASQVDGIDLILSGHSHDRIAQPIVQNGCLIIQSGSGASFVGKLDLVVESGKIRSYRHELIPLYAEQFEEDPEIKSLIEELVRPYSETLSEPIGYLKTTLHRMTLNEAPMDRLITDAYLSYTDADAAFSHGWRYGSPVLPGTLTMNDLYNIIPTNPELFTLDVDGKTLLTALEHNLEQVFAADAYQQKGGYILRSSNIMLTYKPYNPTGHRIQHIEVKGEPLRMDHTYRVAGGGEQIFKNLKDRKWLRVRAHDVLREYIARSKEVSVETQASIIPI